MQQPFIKCIPEVESYAPLLEITGTLLTPPLILQGGSKSAQFGIDFLIHSHFSSTLFETARQTCTSLEVRHRLPNFHI